MLSDSNLLLVVAAAMENSGGQILVQRRPAGKPMAGLWEFPGGKVEAGEVPEAALARELHEELGIVLDPSALVPACFASETLGTRHLVLLLYVLREWDGDVEPRHAEELRWVAPGDLRGLAMPPADVPLVGMLEKLL